MPEVSFVSNGITVNMRLATISDAGLCHDGTIWCLPGSKLMSYSLFQTRPGRNGAQLNVTGNVAIRQHGFDDRSAYTFYRATLDASRNGQIPYTFVLGDSMIVTESLDAIDNANGVHRGYFPSEVYRGCIKRMTAVVCTSTGPASANDLRPAAFGNATQKAATAWIPYATVQAGCALLPTRVQTAGWTGGAVGHIGTQFLGDGAIGGWTTEDIAPAEQNGGYGRPFNTNVSLDLAALVSDIGLANKYPIALGVCQAAVDIMTGLLSGRDLDAGGGHCQGRKSLIIMAGHILGIASYVDPAFTLAAAGFGALAFQEDQAYFPKVWANGWTAGWRFHQPQPPGQYYPGLEGVELAIKPDGWSQEPPSPYHTSMWFAMHGYYPDVHESSVGSALAMLEIGRKNEVGINFVESARQYNRGPSAGYIAAMASAGVSPDFGTSHSDKSAAIPQGWCARELFRLWP